MPRIFLAHTKGAPDEVIDDWVEATAVLWRTPTVAGRDDYLKRSRALGGWNHWVRDVPVAEEWDGTPLFSTVVIPVMHFDMPTIGTATQALIRGFLAAGKPVYAWDPETNEIRGVLDVVDTNSDSWQDAGMLMLCT